MRLAFICAAAALVTASLGCAAKPEPASTTATASKQTKPKKPRKVCRSERSTGSAIPIRICRTVEETSGPAKQTAAAPAPAVHSRDTTAAN